MLMLPIARTLAELLGLAPADTGKPGQIHTDLYGRLHVTSSGGAPAAGAATEAKQDTQTTALGLLATQVTAAAILARLPAAFGAGGGVKIDGSGTAIPVSGTIATAPTIGTAAAGLSFYANRGAATNAEVKSSAGNVYWISSINTSAAPIYIQLHNVAAGVTGARAVGADGLSFLVPANGERAVGLSDLGGVPFNFGTALSFAVSTTRDTFTAGTAADASTQIGYK